MSLGIISLELAVFNSLAMGSASLRDDGMEWEGIAKIECFERTSEVDGDCVNHFDGSSWEALIWNLFSPDIVEFLNGCLLLHVLTRE